MSDQITVIPLLKKCQRHCRWCENTAAACGNQLQSRSNQRFTLNTFKIWQPIARHGDLDHRFKQEVAAIWCDNFKCIHEVNSFQILCNKKLMLEIQEVNCLPRSKYLYLEIVPRKSNEKFILYFLFTFEFITNWTNTFSNIFWKNYPRQRIIIEEKNSENSEKLSLKHYKHLEKFWKKVYETLKNIADI